ncbi:MAG: winged helix-turn-helix transcriptional regulator [Chloroflexi bacterium]|nr:winged helix-turn-helix transcriptional regulator [Chloroflexota bacterium]
MRLMQAGESAAVVGVASVGKSNLVRCLQQADVQEEHLGPDKDDSLIVLVDSHDLTSITEWNFLELLLYRLLLHCQNANLPAEIVSRLEGLHEKLLNRSDDLTNAQRCVEQAFHWLCQVNQRRVVLLLDEFEVLYQQLSPRTWINLRSLRDKNKYSLAYLLFLRRDLEDVLPTTPEVKAFAELFQTHIVGLTPYDLPGTALMLDRLSSRQQVEWPAQYTTHVFDLSGGHGGLIRVIFGKLLPALKGNQTIEFGGLSHDAEVKEECGKIWVSLSDQERGLLQEFVETGKDEALNRDAHALERLDRKGLIVYESTQQPRLFSQLFADFVRYLGSAGQTKLHFYFDPGQQSCWIDGREINLPGLPVQLLGFLYQNQGRNCRRIELLQHLYPHEDHNQLGKIPDFRLDAVVKSLREKIEPDPQNPRYVKTVRGVGFRLDIA